MNIWVDSQVCVMALFALAVYFGLRFFGPIQRREQADDSKAEAVTR